MSIEDTGKRLREARIERLMSISELAKAADVTYITILNIEKGVTLQSRKLEQIAEALNVNRAWLQFGEPWASKDVL